MGYTIKKTKHSNNETPHQRNKIWRTINNFIAKLEKNSSTKIKTVCLSERYRRIVWQILYFSSTLSRFLLPGQSASLFDGVRSVSTTEAALLWLSVHSAQKTAERLNVRPARSKYSSTVSSLNKRLWIVAHLHNGRSIRPHCWANGFKAVAQQCAQNTIIDTLLVLDCCNTGDRHQELCFFNYAPSCQRMNFSLTFW